MLFKDDGMNYLPYHIYAKSSEFEDREIVQFLERIFIFAFDKLLEETKGHRENACASS